MGKTCVVCEKPIFDARGRSSEVCSDECRLTLLKKSVTKRWKGEGHCKVCNEPTRVFHDRSSMYCSIKCCDIVNKIKFLLKRLGKKTVETK